MRMFVLILKPYVDCAPASTAQAATDSVAQGV
jgi:hypothetical protein